MPWLASGRNPEVHARRPRAQRGRGSDPRQADSEARREGSGPIVEPGHVGARGLRDVRRARSSGGRRSSGRSLDLCTKTPPTDRYRSSYTESGQTHARARRIGGIAEARASRTRGRHARAHSDRAPRGRSEDARGRRDGAPHAPERDARTIEKSSRSWPRRKAPRPENAIKTRAAVRPCVFEVFHVDRAQVKWRTAPEEWRPPTQTPPSDCPGPPIGCSDHAHGSPYKTRMREDCIHRVRVRDTCPE
jgi:hypothetical protein